MDIKKNFQTAVKELLKETEDEISTAQTGTAQTFDSTVDMAQYMAVPEIPVEEFIEKLPEEDELLYEDEQLMYSSSSQSSTANAFAGSYSAAGYNETGNYNQPSYSQTQSPAFTTDMQTSLICADTLITGNISTAGHINMAGSLNGNLEAKGDVKISGQVAGNIKGENIDLVSCTVKGNTTATSSVIINSESRIVGDVSANELIMDGKIKGNVTVENSVVFKANATVIGNIIARSISVEGGAVIKGEMLIQNDQEDDSEFDEII